MGKIWGLQNTQPVYNTDILTSSMARHRPLLTNLNVFVEVLFEEREKPNFEGGSG